MFQAGLKAPTKGLKAINGSKQLSRFHRNLSEGKKKGVLFSNEPA